MRCVWVLALCLGWAAQAEAQRIIYDGKRDTSAQQAAAAAKEITSGTLFDSMLRNVDAQARLEVDTVTAFAKEQMRAKLNAFKVWSDPKAQPVAPGDFSPEGLERRKQCPRSVDCVLKTLKQQHQAALSAPAITPVELARRLDQIKAKRAQLQTDLEKLQDANKSKDPVIVRAFAALEDPGADVLEYVQKIAKSQDALAKGIGPALDAIEAGLDQVLAMYHAIESIWRGPQAVSVDPASLRPPSQQIDLQLLAVDQAYLKNLARIEARKQLEVGAALAGVESALNLLTAAAVAESTESIETTLRAVANGHQRERLFLLVLALHEAASAVAAVDAANALAQLRVSDEERRYSIRRSAVNTSTYDLTIQAAVQRLALYWKGGLKPAELAQFFFYVTNTFALPAIAIKQE